MIPKPSRVPRKQGIYCFINKKGEIIYIGKAENLHYRFKEYWKEWKQLQNLKKCKRNYKIFLFAKQYRLIVQRLEEVFVVKFVFNFSNMPQKEKDLIQLYEPKYNCQFLVNQSRYGIETDKANKDLRKIFDFNEKSEKEQAESYYQETIAAAIKGYGEKN